MVLVVKGEMLAVAVTADSVMLVVVVVFCVASDAGSNSLSADSTSCGRTRPGPPSLTSTTARPQPPPWGRDCRATGARRRGSSASTWDILIRQEHGVETRWLALDVQLGAFRTASDVSGPNQKEAWS